MPEKYFGEQVPQPARLAALRGPWRIERHDNWPDMYQLSGAIPGEDDWEWVEPDNEAHMALRAEAMNRLPNMLLELQETYDLLGDMNDRGEIDGPGYSPDWTTDDGSPDKTGRRLWTLMQCIGMTLSEIEQRGVELGLDEEDRAADRKAPDTREG